MINWQDYSVVAVRSAAILTNSYVAGTIIGAKNSTVNSSSPTDICLEGYNQIAVLVAFTKGSLTTAEVKVEWGIDDGAGSYTWFQDTFVKYSGGTAESSLGEYQLSATGNYIITLPIKARYIRVSAKGTGTVTDSSMTIKTIIGTV